MNIPAVLADGTWIDNFRVLRRLGRGGFGVTYLAEEFREWETGGNSRDTGSPLRQVAIKEFFPRGLANRVEGNTVAVSNELEGAGQGFQMALKGFFQEAESLMRFDHPNVIKIYRVFQRNGTAYFVMPYLRGEPLKSIIKREGAMGEDRARRLLMPILDGLIHAHARGILHRDLKPDNVMVPDEGGSVLIDFGAARAQILEDQAEYTRHSELVAYSPGYAALEQYGRATRDNLHGSHTDVYGMAAVLYHAVTGEAPVESSQRSLNITNGSDDPLIPVSLRLKGRGGFSRSFLSGIDWGLELAGRHRPQTMEDFRDALDGKVSVPEGTRQRLQGQGVNTETLNQFPGGAAPFAHTGTSSSLEQSRPAAADTDTVLYSRPFSDSQQAAYPAQPSSQASSAPLHTGTNQSHSQAYGQTDTAAMGVAQVSAVGEPKKKKKPRLLLILLLIGSGAAALILGRPALEEVLRDPLPQNIRAQIPQKLVDFLSLNSAEISSGTEVPEAAENASAEDESALEKSENNILEAEAAREAYAAAKQVNTIGAWQAFKDAFPESPLVTTANIRIDALADKESNQRTAEVGAPRASPPAPAEIDAPTTKLARAQKAAPKQAALAPAVERAPAPKPAPEPQSAPEPAAPQAVTPFAAPKPAAQAAPIPALKPEPPSPRLSAGGTRDCSGCPEIVRVAGGNFEMGDISGNGESDELPLRNFRLAPFYAGRYEVTFDEWDRCASAGACRANPSDGGFGRGRRPVINVSWNDAQRFVRWLTSRSGKPYRLPTEAEFEYLHRAGARTAYPWGDDGSAACSYGNVADAQAKKRKPKWSTFNCDDGHAYTAIVGSFRPNAFGLYDVAGNVWEWTQDCYGSYRSAPKDGAANEPVACSRRVVRGGSWGDATRNLRSADRTASAPNSTLNIVGFRVVRD